MKSNPEKLAKPRTVSRRQAVSSRFLFTSQSIADCHREFSRAAGSQPCPKGLLPVVRNAKAAKDMPPIVRKKSRK